MNRFSSSRTRMFAIVCLSIAGLGCPSGGKDKGPTCAFDVKQVYGTSEYLFELCSEAKGVTEEQCSATYGGGDWDTYESCEDALSGGETWVKCPGHDDLWIEDASFYGDGGDGMEFDAPCAAASEMLGLDGSSDDDDGDDGDNGDGEGMSTLDWGPSCDSSRAEGWFCVDCEAESMESPPYGLGTDDIQVWSQCAAACTRWDQSHGEQYANPTDQQSFKDAVTGSCDVLGQFDSNNASNGITSAYRASCQYCP